MAMAHGNLCRHGWVPSQPLLVIVSPFYPFPPLLISPSLGFSALPLQLFFSPHLEPPPPHHRRLSFSQQGSSGHWSPPSLKKKKKKALPLHLNAPPPTSTSTLPQPLFLSERMFQPLHTDSSGILCVEMFLLDPQALTIYRTKARAPLLKAWHLWPPANTSDLSLRLIFLSPQPLGYGCAGFQGGFFFFFLERSKVDSRKS